MRLLSILKLLKILISFFANSNTLPGFCAQQYALFNFIKSSKIDELMALAERATIFFNIDFIAYTVIQVITLIPSFGQALRPLAYILNNF